MGNKYTSGAVSIFAVIFATLLLTVLTIGFISLMIVAQQRAINNDLSQSAYDAALAGVEDAKRAVRACADGKTTVCAALAASADCKVVARAGINGDVDENETRITSNSSSGGQFDQAYTCVNISMNSPDYLAKMTTSNTQIVPLKATGGVNRIVIQWFTQEDNGGQNAAAPGGDLNSLPPISGWNNGAPPLLRVQLITPGESFSLNELNDTVKSSTVFLRPSTVAPGVPSPLQEVTINNGSPARATVVGSYDNGLSPVRCSSDFLQEGYACQVTLRLEENRGISEAASQNALLRLDLMYRDANVRVSLFNDAASVDFNGVQPVVDSTGRTSDLFRRVESRLRMGSEFSYPSYVVDLENALCKDFAVNDTGATGSCNP